MDEQLTSLYLHLHLYFNLPTFQLVILYMEEYLISFYVLVFLLDLLVLGLPIQGGVADLLVLAGALQAGGLHR